MHVSSANMRVLTCGKTDVRRLDFQRRRSKGAENGEPR